jgi:hypothetical protein
MESNEIGLLLAKVEGTYGTDPTPTNASNLLPVLRDSIAFRLVSEPIGRKFLTGGIAPNIGFNTVPTGELSFTYELRGNLRNGTTQLDITNGTSTQALEIDNLLKSCGMSPTYTAAGTPGSEGSSAGSRDGFVIYSPSFSSSDEGTSMTFYWQTANKRHKLTGAKGTVRLSAEAGKVPMLSFTFRGLYVAPADSDLSTSSAAWFDLLPPLFQGSSITIGSYEPVLTSMEFDLGNEIVRRDSAVATNGVKGFLIADVMPKARLNPEAVTEATNPFWSNWINSTPKLITIPFGATAGNKITLSYTGEYKDVNYTNRNKFRHHDIQIDVVKPELDTTDATWVSLKFF